MSSIVSTVTLRIDSTVIVTPPVNLDHCDEFRTSVFLTNSEGGIGAQFAGSIADLRALANNLHTAISLIEDQLKETANV